MKGFLWIGFVLVITTWGSSQKISAQDPPPPPPPAIFKAPIPSELTSFTSADGTFEAVFPGKPNVDKAAGTDVVAESTYFSRNGARTSVTVLIFPTDLEPMKEGFLRNYKAKFLSDGKTTIEAERDDENGGRPYKEFNIKNGYIYEIRRIFIVKSRLFEIKTSATNWHIIGEETKRSFFKEAERFLASFKILK